MKWKTWITTCSIVVAITMMSGCGGDNGTTPSRAEAPSAEEAETLLGTMDEYRAEAAEEITAENAEEKLLSLQKEIEDDIESGD